MDTINVPISKSEIIMSHIDWLKEGDIENIKIMEGDQYTQLYKIHIKNNLNGYYYEGEDNDLAFELFFEVEEHSKNDTIYLQIKKVYLFEKSFSKKNYKQNIYNNRLIEHYIKLGFKEYILRNNFSMWNGNSQPTLNKLIINFDKNILFFNKDEIQKYKLFFLNYKYNSRNKKNN